MFYVKCSPILIPYMVKCILSNVANHLKIILLKVVHAHSILIGFYFHLNNSFKPQKNVSPQGGKR